MLVTTQHGKGKKIHVFFNGEYTATTNVDFWSDNFIKDNSDISEDEAELLLSKINFTKAVNKAYDYLAVRDYSKAELTRKLMRLFDSETSLRAIEKIESFGYIDDERYAKQLIKHLVENKKFAPPRIRQEMRKRGVDAQIIEDLMSETSIDTIEQICELLNGKYSRKLSDEKSRQRTFNALVRLGYGYSDIKSAFSRRENEINTYEE